jgi:Icc-related predicted phosphoesterase
MKCLVVGDPHIGESRTQPTVPDSWQEYDVIIFPGDILDHSASGSGLGRELLRELDELDLETIVIPGNHDFNYYPELTDGISSVQSVHQSAITIDGWMFYGLGSDRFDDGSEVRYPEIPELSDAESNPERFEQQLADIVMGRSDLTDILETKHAIKTAREPLQLYRKRLKTLDNLPPFGTGIDQLSVSNPRYPGRMLGSIAVRSHIRRSSPSFNFCGHIHEGEGVVESDGCICLNAGRRSTYSVRLEQKHLDAVTLRSQDIIE